MSVKKDMTIIIPGKGKDSATALPILGDLANQVNAPSFDVVVMSKKESVSEAILKSAGKIILFLSESSRVSSPDFLRRHFELHEQLANVWGIAGGVELRDESSLMEKCFHSWEQNSLSMASMIRPFTRKIGILNSSFKREAFDEDGDWLSHQFSQGVIRSGFGSDDKRLAFFPDLQITAQSSNLIPNSCLISAVRRGLREGLEGTGWGRSGERYYHEPALRICVTESVMQVILSNLYFFIIALLYQTGWELAPFSRAKFSRYPSILRSMLGNFLGQLRKMSLIRESRYILRFVALTSGYGKTNPFDETSTTSAGSGRPISRTASYEIVRLK